MEAIANMNGTLWIFAAILIALVLVQSFLFLRLALRFNKRNGNLVSKEELRGAMQTGAVAAVGPALNSIAVALSLIAMVGSATTFMRCGVIGAPIWELYMANIAAASAGVTLGSAECTEAVFTFCIFCMVLGSAPYFINTMIMLKPLDNMVEKSKEKKAKVSFMPYMASGAMMGLLGYSIFTYFTSVALTAAVIASAIGWWLFEQVAKKLHSKTLSSFSLAFGMVCAMVVGELITLSMA